MATFKVNQNDTDYTLKLNADAIESVTVAPRGAKAFQAEVGARLEIGGHEYVVGNDWRNQPAFHPDMRKGLEAAHATFPTRYEELTLH